MTAVVIIKSNLGLSIGMDRNLELNGYVFQGGLSKIIEIPPLKGALAFTGSLNFALKWASVIGNLQQVGMRSLEVNWNPQKNLNALAPLLAHGGQTFFHCGIENNVTVVIGYESKVTVLGQLPYLANDLSLDDCITWPFTPASSPLTMTEINNPSFVQFANASLPQLESSLLALLRVQKVEDISRGGHANIGGDGDYFHILLTGKTVSGSLGPI